MTFRQSKTNGEILNYKFDVYIAYLLEKPPRRELVYGSSEDSRCQRDEDPPPFGWSLSDAEKRLSSGPLRHPPPLPGALPVLPVVPPPRPVVPSAPGGAFHLMEY